MTFVDLDDATGPPDFATFRGLYLDSPQTRPDETFVSPGRAEGVELRPC
jgi:hypothetical protein